MSQLPVSRRYRVEVQQSLRIRRCALAYQVDALPLLVRLRPYGPLRLLPHCAAMSLKSVALSGLLVPKAGCHQPPIARPGRLCQPRIAGGRYVIINAKDQRQVGNLSRMACATSRDFRH